MNVLLKNVNKFWVYEMVLGFDKLELFVYLKYEMEEMIFGKCKKKIFFFL